MATQIQLRERVLAYADALNRTAADETDVASADDLIACRLALYEALICAGWMPPAHVLTMMETDRAVLREGLGAIAEQMEQADPRVRHAGCTGGSPTA